MPFRFRRSVTLFPGLRLNLNKRSSSITFGGRGLHTTFRPGHKARTTIGLPGTGVSYTEGGQVRRPNTDYRPPEPPMTRSIGVIVGWIVAAMVVVVLGIKLGLVLGR